MFNMNQGYKRPIVERIVAPIVLPIELPIPIKHVHSCVSYQWATSQKYDQRGCGTPSGNGALACGRGTPGPGGDYLFSNHALVGLLILLHL